MVLPAMILSAKRILTWFHPQSGQQPPPAVKPSGGKIRVEIASGDKTTQRKDIRNLCVSAVSSWSFAES
jgi:hypothetical protein